MPNYRVYFFGLDGHIRRAEELSCSDDGQAIAYMLAHESPEPKELWDGARRVHVYLPGKDSHRGQTSAVTDR